MAKGKSAKGIGRSHAHVVKGRTKISSKKETASKSRKASQGVVDVAPPHATTPASATPAIVRGISREELKKFNQLLELLKSDTEGMFLLVNHLNPDQRKALLGLLSNELSAPSKDTTSKLREELKRNEAVLRSLHARERAFQDVVHGILVVLDSGRVIRTIGKSACQLLGYSEAELIGKNWIEAVVPASRVTAVQTILGHLFNETLSDEFEHPVVTRSGEERMISWRVAVLRDGSGQVNGLVCAGEDLTILRQTHSALERSEERLHLMMDSVGEDEFFITDPDGFVVSWIARSKDGKSFRAEEMVGRHFSCLYSPEDFQAGKPMRILETAQNGGRYEEDGWRIRKDGSRSRAYIIVTAIRDNERNLLGFSNVTKYVVEAADAHAKRLFPLSVPIVEYP